MISFTAYFDRWQRRFDLVNKQLLLFAFVSQAGYIRIDGSVPSSERIQLVHKFQNDPDTRVAILSIQAAGQVPYASMHAHHTQKERSVACQ